MTGSYISQLESGQRRPLIPRRVATLCKALGIPSGPLAEAAALERSAPNIRKRIEGLDRERAKVRRMRDRLLLGAVHEVALHGVGHEDLMAAGDFDAEVRRHILSLAHRVKGHATLRPFEEIDTSLLEGLGGRERDALLRALPAVLRIVRDRHRGPSGPSDARVLPVCTGLDPRGPAVGTRFIDPADACGPDAWFLVAPDDDGHPRVERGDLLLLDPDTAAAAGDLVVVSHDGRPRIGRYLPHGAVARVEGLRPDVPPLRLSPGEAMIVVRRIERVLR